MFCRLISSQYFLFTFGKISLFVVMFLAIERWFAIARPITYRLSFKRNKVIACMTLIVVLCFAMNTPALLQKRLVLKENKPYCKRSEITQGKLAAQIYTVLHVTVTFFIPLFITWATFLDLRMLLKKSPAQNQSHGARNRSERHFLRMCAVTALFLGICWIPNQFIYMLSKFGVTQLDTTLHHVTVVLSMLNSCINPWIYGATNKKYRRDFRRILCFWERTKIHKEETEKNTKLTVICRLNNTEPQTENTGESHAEIKTEPE